MREPLSAATQDAVFEPLGNPGPDRQFACALSLTDSAIATSAEAVDRSGLDLLQRRIRRGDVVLLLDGDMVTRFAMPAIQDHIGVSQALTS
jgi:hypothetical protein